MTRPLSIRNCLWIFITQIILIAGGFKPEDTACDLVDLDPGRALRCTDKDNIPITAALEVPSGSSCDIICPYKEVKAWTTCDDGKWDDYYRTYCKEAHVAQSAHLSRPKRSFRRFLRAIGRFFRCLFGCVRHRDTTPPTLNCPRNIHENARKLQTWAVVTWVEPTANDGRDGGITPTREGKAPGSYFSSGVTTVGYYARDRSGNMARCTFTITVTVVRCPWPSRVANGYFICHPSDDARYGATCRFGCYPGYELAGDPQLECLVTGSWNHFAPQCEKITCQVLLPAVGNRNYKCTDDNKFRSICTYSCSAGYDITLGMSRVRVCTAYGMWRGAEPTCTDIEPPKLQGCIHTVYAFAERNSTTGVVTWTEPTAVDNHDGVVNVVKVGSVSPGDRLSAGSYKIIYKATDAAGNQAQTCQTDVVMKVLKCPVVYPTPFLSVTCPWGTKYGSQCEFNCDSGSVRNGSKIVVCEKSGSGNYGYWTWGDMQPYCQVIQKCFKEPNVPMNGALACDYWLGGKFCQMLCKSGYDVQLGQIFVDMLVCGDSGQWLPAGSLPLPDCAESRLPRRGRIPMSATYYFTGDCTDPSVQDQIKEKFIQTLSASVYKDACLIHAKDCKVENVQVKCGQKARRKRSIDGTMRIYFDIAAEFEDATFRESFADFRRHQSEIIENINEAKTAGNLDFNISETALMEATDIDNLDVVLECPENAIPSYKTTSCVKCPEGTFYNNVTLTCKMCSRGKYQPSPGQSYCLSCPFGKTTRTTGAHSLSQCEEGCEPGSWSPNGTPECSLCTIGTFSDSYGASQCTPCPGSKSTTEEGSTNITQCQDFDLRMTEFGSETSTDFAVPISTETIVTFWLQREISTGNDFRVEIINVDTGMLNFYMAISAGIKIGKPGYENVTNYIFDNDRWHSYMIKHSTDSTELYVDGAIEANSYLAVMFNGNMTISLKGQGTVSGLNIWIANSTTSPMLMNTFHKCNNGGFGNVVSWKAFELTSNDNVFKQTPSECDDVDNCLSNPCLNGECRDLLGGHECHCHFGFSGDNCEENIDDCNDHACENNATCVDGAANYTCQCQYGYKGELCEISMVDGSWGDWGEWSPCSITCGNGTQHRYRICNDPAPDNGGLDCPDNSSESRTCSETKCKECISLERLDNVIWTCTNDSDNINCTIDCAAGYDFDHEIKPYYLCGIDTFYLWDFQTDDNPDGKMPFCSEIKDSKKLQVSYVASYKDLQCDTSIKYKDTHRSIPEAVQLGLNNIECVSTGVCFLDRVTVTKCNQRQKRSTLTSNAGVDVSLSCDPAVHGTETCYTLLYAAVNDIQLMAINQTLDVDIQGSIYKIDPDSALADGTVSCPTGMVPMKFYCIPCAPGRYYKNDECLECDFGTYQDRSGQLSCKVCPNGRTTPGRESRSVIECSVKVDSSTDESIPIIAGVLISVLVLTIIVIVIIVFRRYLNRSKKEEYNPSSIFNVQSGEQKCVSETSFDHVQSPRIWKKESPATH